MKLAVLADNSTFVGTPYTGEAGFSCYIEDGEDCILFDTGRTDLFLRNAKAMGIDLGRVRTIVLSHGHDDHTGGLTEFARQFDMSRVTVVAHPDAFAYRRIRGRYAGSPLSASQLSSMGCQVKLSADPLRISENIAFLGQIPRALDFEPGGVLGERRVDEVMQPDDLPDDTGLAYRSSRGIFVITGCAHSGVCNMVERARQVCGDSRVVGVLGGFHMLQADDHTRAALGYFRDNGITELYPCHCTGFMARACFQNAMPIHDVAVGFAVEVK